MAKRIFTTEQLDRFGREMIAAGRTSDEEVEKIVAAPYLFASVKARIENREELNRQRAATANLTNSGGKNSLRLTALSTRRLAFAAIVSCLLTGAFLVIFLSKKDTPVELHVSAPTALDSSPIAAETARFGSLSEYSAPGIIVSNKLRSSSRQPVKIQSKSRKIEIVKTPARTAREKPRAKTSPSGADKTGGEFYALSFPVQSDEPLRIVRAELSPSALFALGVNLPIENGSQKIKTDLLVGADGVARAIRLIE